MKRPFCDTATKICQYLIPNALLPLAKPFHHPRCVADTLHQISNPNVLVGGVCLPTGVAKTRRDHWQLQYVDEGVIWPAAANDGFYHWLFATKTASPLPLSAKIRTP